MTYVAYQDKSCFQMDDLRFYILFNGILVISGRREVIMKDCVQWNPVYHLQRKSWPPKDC